MVHELPANLKKLADFLLQCLAFEASPDRVYEEQSEDLTKAIAVVITVTQESEPQ